MPKSSKSPSDCFAASLLKPHSAGSKDSELTNHGYQQATRLGLHFKSLGLSFTHIFSSHLQRAAKTAGLIRTAQSQIGTDDAPSKLVPEVVQLPVLMEQDFGFYEGKKWNERTPDSRLAGSEGFVDIESKESIAQRADAFLDLHLLPLLHGATETVEPVVAVVSHGIMLSVLWKRLLLRLPARSVELAPELSTIPRATLEHLGGWSNTGYLEVHMVRTSPLEPSGLGEEVSPVSPNLVPPKPTVASEAAASKQTQVSHGTVTMAITGQVPVENAQASIVAAPSTPLKLAPGWMTVVRTINGKDHLVGLKRTGGGVGSSRHDASQKNIESFFKRRKVE